MDRIRIALILILVMASAASAVDTVNVPVTIATTIAEAGNAYSYIQEPILKLGADRGSGGGYELRFIAKATDVDDSVPSNDAAVILAANWCFYTEISPTAGLGQWIGTTEVWNRRILKAWDTASGVGGFPSWLYRREGGMIDSLWGIGFLPDSAAYGAAPPYATSYAYEGLVASVDTNANTLIRIPVSPQTIRYWRDNPTLNYGCVFGAVSQGTGGNHNDREFYGPSSSQWGSGKEGYLEVIYTTEFTKASGIKANGVKF